MKFVKKVWDKIKAPKIVPLLIFYMLFIILVAVTLYLVISNPNKQGVLNYILYFVSAICLTYFVYTVVIISPKIKNKILLILKKFKFTNSLLENYGYRTIMFGTVSFVINIAYVILIGILAIKTSSVWYMSIAIYYFVLILMKGNVFYYHRQNDSKLKEIKTYRATGIMFIFLTFAMSGIIVLIYKSNMYFEYAGLMIYVFATFTFYKLSLSIYNIFKARKQDNLFIQNVRNINLASALVSLIVLQVAMFQAFAPEHNTCFANALTGGAVAALILAIGVYMIIESNKKLKQINTGEKNEKQ